MFHANFFSVFFALSASYSLTIWWESMLVCVCGYGVLVCVHHTPPWKLKRVRCLGAKIYRLSPYRKRQQTSLDPYPTKRQKTMTGPGVINSEPPTRTYYALAGRVTPRSTIGQEQVHRQLKLHHRERPIKRQHFFAHFFLRAHTHTHTQRETPLIFVNFQANFVLLRGFRTTLENTLDLF